MKFSEVSRKIKECEYTTSTSKSRDSYSYESIFHDNCVSAIVEELGVSKDIADVIYDSAYKQCYTDGFSSILSYIQEVGKRLGKDTRITKIA